MVGKESGIEFKNKYIENKAQDKTRILNLEKTVCTEMEENHGMFHGSGMNQSIYTVVTI